MATQKESVIKLVNPAPPMIDGCLSSSTMMVIPKIISISLPPNGTREDIAWIVSTKEHIQDGNVPQRAVHIPIRILWSGDI